MRQDRGERQEPYRSPGYGPGARGWRRAQRILNWWYWLKGADLSNRDSPARKANREALREHIEEIQAEQADLQARATPPSGPPLQVADRYAGGRPRGR